MIITNIKESASYQFELWAENRHGSSPIAAISTTSKYLQSAFHAHGKNLENLSKCSLTVHYHNNEFLEFDQPILGFQINPTLGCTRAWLH